MLHSALASEPRLQWYREGPVRDLPRESDSDQLTENQTADVRLLQLSREAPFQPAGVFTEGPVPSCLDKKACPDAGRSPDLQFHIAFDESVPNRERHPRT